MTWYSFDRIAAHYDASRILDPEAAGRMLDYVGRILPPGSVGRILELGIGTGRIAYPFSSRGYRVVGIDISGGMLARLRERARADPRSRVEAVRGDAIRLPFRSESFGMTYWVHVLHLVPRWRSALGEVLRVTKPGGFLLDLNTEGGRDLTEPSDRYLALARKRGYRQPRIGVRRRETILAHLAKRGCRIRRVRLSWPWRRQISVGEVLDDLDARAFATLNFLPMPVHGAVMKELKRWARTKFERRSKLVDVSGRIRLQIAKVPS